MPPVPPPKPRSRLNLIVLISVAAAVLVVIVIGLVATRSNGPAKISMPDALLGLRQYTGPGAQDFDAGLVKQAQAADNGILVNPVAGIYGDPVGGSPGLEIVIGRICDGCTISSVSHEVRLAQAHGYTDARSFPPGPKGGGLMCYSDIPQGSRAINCAWADQSYIGDVVFSPGFPAGLDDAAAKARQVRAAIEP